MLNGLATSEVWTGPGQWRALKWTASIWEDSEVLTASHDSRWLRRRLRWGLLAGFGVVVVLLVVVGVYSVRAFGELSSAEGVEVNEFLRRSELMENVQSLLTSATGTVTTYLLNRNASVTPADREQLSRSWSQTVQGFEAYKQVAAPGALGLTDAFDSQLARYRERVDAALERERDQRLDAESRSTLLELIPMRNELFLTIDEIRSRDRAELESRTLRNVQGVRGSERRLWIVIAGTSLLALLIAAATFIHLMSLEGVAASWQAKSSKTASELKRLAGRLMAAQEEERKRIARELHDDCGQRFACLIVELSFAANRPDVSPDLRIAMEAMGESLRKLAQDLQQISRGLHSAVLDTIGLEAAIRSECDGLQRRSQMSVEFVAIGIPRQLSAQISLTLYRVFQEALKNALAYSQADRMEVTLEAEGGEIMLQVRDFGRGFDIGSIDQGGGLGLVSMRERVQMVGGTLAVRSTPGQGTQVVARCSLAG